MNSTDLWLRLRALISRRRVERELQDELDFHVEMQTRKNLRQNADAGEARRLALVRFGGMSKIVEDCRDEHRLNLIDALARDFRHAVRMLRRNPGFTLVAVLTLALAIGANTAIFSVADAVLFRPLPYKDPDRVYILQMMNRQTGTRSTMIPYAYLQLINENRAGVSPVGLIEGSGVLVPGNDGVESVTTAAASKNYFEILGARAARGRLFESSDEDAGRAAVISYSAWRQRFGGDESVIGRSVTVGPMTFNVVGVLPPGFVFPSLFVSKPEVITILQPDRGGAFNPIVRLDAGITREQAQSQIDALAARVSAGDPRMANIVPVLAEVRSVLYRFGGPVMEWLLASTAFLLLIGCANLANMLLVRSHANKRETGVAMALGASRFQLVRLLILESLLVSLAAGAVALGVTYWTFDALLARVPALAYGSAPVGIHFRIIVFALILSVVAGIAFSIAPVWRIFRGNPLALIRQRHDTGSSAHGRLCRPMIVIQVALAVVLVFGAVMTTRTLVSILQVPLGFTADDVLTIRVAPRGATGVERQQVYIQALEAIARRGDVLSVGAGGAIPFSGRAPDELVKAGDSKQPAVGIVHLLPGYFETTGIALRRGRFPDSNDVRDGTGASVISESAAAVLFPGRDPLGGVYENTSGRRFSVVGIVPDVRNGPEQDASPVAYIVPGEATRQLAILARLRNHEDALVRELRREVVALAPGVPVRTEWWSETMDAWTAYRNPRFQTMVLGTLAFLGLGLVALGIFGVIAFLVTIRTNEVGIRLALGAPAPSVVRLMVIQAVTPVTVGVVIGAGITRWISRLAETQLFQVRAHDPLALAASAAMVIVVAVLASYLPARRASRVDPVVALRLE